MQCIECDQRLPLILRDAEAGGATYGHGDEGQVSWQCVFCGAVYHAVFDEDAPLEIVNSAVRRGRSDRVADGGFQSSANVETGTSPVVATHPERSANHGVLRASFATPNRDFDGQSIMTGATVYFIDDDPELALALLQSPEFKELGVRSFSSKKEFIAASNVDSPGCVIASLRLIEGSGHDFQNKLHSPVHGKMPLLVKSDDAGGRFALETMSLGASDVVVKRLELPELLFWIRKCAKANWRRMETLKLIELDRQHFEKLTPRERQVFGFLVQGLTSKNIARELGISHRTIEKFRKGIMKALEADSVAQLVHIAYRIGHTSAGF